MRLGILAASAATLAACAGSPTPAVERNPLACVNLGNALDAPREGQWGYRIEKRDIEAIAAAGFSTVRLPVRWSAYAGFEPPYPIDEPFLQRVDEVVGWALESDLEVVLNVHHYVEFHKDPAAHRDRLVGLWAAIAPHYSDWPDGLIFEVLNEPRGRQVADLWDDIQTEAIEEIRKTNPDRRIVFGGPSWNSLESLEETPRPDADGPLIGTFHYYEPFEFTHQNAPFIRQDLPSRGWGAPEEREEIEAVAARTEAVSERLDAPILLGEFGVYLPGTDPDARWAWYAAVREAAEQAGATWCVWNFAADFAIYDVAESDWLPGALEALGLEEPAPDS